MLYKNEDENVNKQLLLEDYSLNGTLRKLFGSFYFISAVYFLVAKLLYNY